MGNVIYGSRLSCYDNVEACAQACARFECVYVDKCDGHTSAHYVCLPFDTRFFMWLLVGLFLLVVLCCSAIVVCYALRAIRNSFRHALVTENDIVFYNPTNVHTFPHPAMYYTPNNGMTSHGSASSFNNYGVQQQQKGDHRDPQQRMQS